MDATDPDRARPCRHSRQTERLIAAPRQSGVANDINSDKYACDRAIRTFIQIAASFRPDRRATIYSSTLCDWRRQRDAGAFNALTPGRRGPKVAEANPLVTELALSRKDNARLTQRLARAEAIIDIQKKVASLLGIPLAPNSGVP